MLPDDEADLKWFFCEARGDCGVRSSFGYQLELARDGIQKGKFERIPSTEIPDNAAMAGTRANRIAARLRRCTPRTQLVLELHHGAAAKLGTVGVSLALACWTPTARSGYHAAVRAMRGRRSDSARSQALATERMWLLWVSERAQHRDGEVAKKVLDKVLEEASAALRSAHSDYEASR